MANQIKDLDDHIEIRRRQLAKEMPSLDTIGMAVLGRARVITLNVRPEIEKVFARYGLDTGECDVLFTLLRSGKPYRLRPTELFNSLMITSGGLTGRLARLEKAGLIERFPDATDGRSMPVGLTAAGLKTARAAFAEDMKLEAELLTGLSKKELETLAGLLGKLARAIEQRDA
jgi:DNA-binding MarR family transcriptional regulator